MSATKTAVDRFAEYRRDWEAALEPCMACLLRDCPESELPALEALLDDYLERHFESPPYSPVQHRRIVEKIEPLFQRAMNDPAVIAAEDQRKALWRDTPRWRKRYNRARFALLCVRMKIEVRRQPKRWE